MPVTGTVSTLDGYDPFQICMFPEADDPGVLVRYKCQYWWLETDDAEILHAALGEALEYMANRPDANQGDSERNSIGQGGK